jgi:hypothetical protein
LKRGEINNQQLADNWQADCDEEYFVSEQPNGENGFGLQTEEIDKMPTYRYQVLEPTCDRQLNALNMSKNTKHVNVMVVSRGVILLSLI